LEQCWWEWHFKPERGTNRRLPEFCAQTADPQSH